MEEITIPDFIMIPNRQKQGEFLPCIKGSVFNKNSGDYFVCRHYKSCGCPMRVKLLKNENGEYYSYIQSNNSIQHNHSSTDYFNYLQHKQIQEYANNNPFTEKNVVEITTEVTIPQSTMRQSTISKAVRKYLGISSKGKNIQDLELNDEEKEHLLFRNSNMIVFGDKKNIHLLKNSQFVLNDGTFRVTPSLFFFFNLSLIIFIYFYYFT